MSAMYKTLLVLGLVAAVWSQEPESSYTLQELLEAMAKQGMAGGAAGMPVNNMLVALLQLLLRNFLRPLLSNMGVGMANALTASFMGRELTLIPDAVSPIPQRG